MNITEIFKPILSLDRLIEGDRLEQLYKTSTTGFKTSVKAVLQPASCDEIEAIVKIANKHNFKLYPVSSGKNWGYSDDFPMQDNNIILDLSLMNKIIDYNAELSYVTIEPGVTQAQLADFLKTHGDQHIISVTGSSKYASIVGNYLERGFGISPIMDHVTAVTSIEAILGDASHYKSILSQKGCGQIDKVYQHAVGPNLDALFFQSAMGIVTSMTFKLARKAEQMILATGDFKKQDFDLVLSTLIKLRHKWNLPSLSIKVFNNLYVAAASGVPYPEKVMKEQKILLQEEAIKLCEANDIGEFSVLVTSGGPKALMKILSKDIKTLRSVGVSDLKYVDQFKYDLAMLVRRFLPSHLSHKLKALQSVWNYMRGIPSDDTLKFAYWRTGISKSDSDKNDPARDNCGIIWYAPILPFTSDACQKFENLVREVCVKYNVNPMMSITNYSGDYCVGLSAILFDQDKQTQQAQECYLELLQKGQNLGFYPYRLSAFAMQHTFDQAALGERVKNIVDPNNVISPGCYNNSK